MKEKDGDLIVLKVLNKGLIQGKGVSRIFDEGAGRTFFFNFKADLIFKANYRIFRKFLCQILKFCVNLRQILIFLGKFSYMMNSGIFLKF